MILFNSPTTEISICSGATHKGKGDFTNTIEQILLISIYHEYKELNIII
jgi:hypothetical protein